MDFMTLAATRQSVRKYASTPVSRENLQTCIEAARLAPSACNSQPWSFIVVDDADLKNKMVKASCSGIYSMNAFAAEAPVMVVILTEKMRISAALGALIRNVQYKLIDLGIVCEHLCLRAAELGLGTCMLGWFNERAVRKTLALPWGTHIDLLITLGYPADSEIREKKRKPLKEILSFNRGK